MPERTSDKEKSFVPERLLKKEARIEPIFIEQNSHFNTDQYLNNLFLVPPSYGEEHALAGLIMKPEPKWHFFEKPGPDTKAPSDPVHEIEKWDLQAFSASDDHWYEIRRYTLGRGRTENPLKGGLVPIDTLYFFDRLSNQKIVIEIGNQDTMFREGTISQNGGLVAFIRQKREPLSDSRWNSFVDKSVVIKKIITHGDRTKEVADLYEIPLVQTDYSLSRDAFMQFSRTGRFLSFIESRRNPEKNLQKINDINTPYLKIVDTETGEVKTAKLLNGVGTVEHAPAWNIEGNALAVVVDQYEEGYIKIGKLLQIVDAATGESKKIEMEDTTYLGTLDVTPDNKIVIFQKDNVTSDDPEHHDILQVFDFEGKIVSKHYLHPDTSWNRHFIVNPLDQTDKSYLVFSNMVQYGDEDRRPWMTLVDIENGRQITLDTLFEGVEEDIFSNDAYDKPHAKKTGGR